MAKYLCKLVQVLRYHGLRDGYCFLALHPQLYLETEISAEKTQNIF